MNRNVYEVFTKSVSNYQLRFRPLETGDCYDNVYGVICFNPLTTISNKETCHDFIIWKKCFLGNTSVMIYVAGLTLQLHNNELPVAKGCYKKQCYILTYRPSYYTRVF